MKYYKNIDDKYITAIGIGIGDVEIKKDEYDEIMDIIKNKPITPSGFMYRLNINLEYELIEKKMYYEESQENN